MCKTMDVANFFIDVTDTDYDDGMTNFRLNKLMYFAQAYSLVRTGKPLFSERIEAWEHGPVIRPVYDTFKKYGKNIIPATVGEYSEDCFSDEEIEILTDTMVRFGKYSTNRLYGMTHKPGAPWDKVFVKNMNNLITNESIQEYYKDSDEMKPFKIHYNPEDIYSKRDEKDGLLILPAEENDDAE